MPDMAYQQEVPERNLKPVVWMGNALGVLKTFPSAVQDEVGYALDHHGDTFRAVYTVRLSDRVYVLHAFQKKSKRGIATPQAEIELIKRRLKLAEAISEWLE